MSQVIRSKWVNYVLCKLYLNKTFIFEILKLIFERREGQRETPKQALCLVWSLTWGSVPQPRDRDLS